MLPPIELRFGRIVAEHAEADAVVAREAVERADPDEAVTILREPVDGARRQAIRDTRHHELRRRRRRPGRGDARHRDQQPCGDQRRRGKAIHVSLRLPILPRRGLRPQPSIWRRESHLTPLPSFRRRPESAPSSFRRRPKSSSPSFPRKAEIQFSVIPAKAGIQFSVIPAEGRIQFSVIPAKAGIQFSVIPAKAGIHFDFALCFGLRRSRDNRLTSLCRFVRHPWRPVTFFCLPKRK